MVKPNTDGIPDVDLASVKAEVEAEAPDLGQFKTVEDQVKGYKELQGAFTRTSQELADLKKSADPAQVEALQAELASLKEQQELSQYQLVLE